MRALAVLISAVLLVVALLFASGRSFEGQAEYRPVRRSVAETRIEQREKPVTPAVGQMPSGYRTMHRVASTNRGKTGAGT